MENYMSALLIHYFFYFASSPLISSLNFILLLFEFLSLLYIQYDKRNKKKKKLSINHFSDVNMHFLFTTFYKNIRNS